MRKLPLLEVKGIHKFFGRIHALDDVSFHIYPGEVVGLVGDNGSGKSTFIKILSGVISPDKGKILYKGKEVRISSVKVARSLGIETVHQHRKTSPDRTVAQNIFLGRELCNRWGLVDEEEMEEISSKIMESLHLDVPPDQEVQFCSGGERQGVAMARPMYFKAKLIILDEPTTALSIRGVTRVMDFIKELKKKGMAIIFVTHNIGHVYPVSDRFVIFSHQGRKIADVPKRRISEEKLRSLILRSSIRGPARG